VGAGFTPGAGGSETRLHTGIGEGGSETRPHTGMGGFEPKTLEDRWILSRFNRVAQQVHESLDAYRFDNAATSIYDFFWGEFCDWYIELIKPRLAEGADEEAAGIACRNLVLLFEASLRLLHPVMPFITEEIWQAIYDGKPPLKSIALACYPTADQHQVELQAETDMAILQDLIVSVRNLRAELKIEQKLRVPIQVYAEDGTVRALIEQNAGAVERLASVQHIEFAQGSLAKLAGARHTARLDVHVVYAKPIDAAAERARLQKELERIEKEIANGQRQLSNEQFLAKAPADVVEGLRRRAGELEVLRDKTKSKLDELQ
jgi:valyl-tRNA synthetase